MAILRTPPATCPSVESDDAVPAGAFRQFHERGGHEALLDALTDLEADPILRGWLAEHLRLQLTV